MRDAASTLRAKTRKIDTLRLAPEGKPIETLLSGTITIKTSVDSTKVNMLTVLENCELKGSGGVKVGVFQPKKEAQGSENEERMSHNRVCSNLDGGESDGPLILIERPQMQVEVLTAPNDS